MVSYENFTAVNVRCAVDMGVLLTKLLGECGEQDVLAVFDGLGIGHSPIDLAGIARSQINTAVYRSGARMSAAPDIFDCSSFTKWCYARAGIWLPRLAIQQYECGCELLPILSLVWLFGHRPMTGSLS